MDATKTEIELIRLLKELYLNRIPVIHAFIKVKEVFK